MRRMTMYMTEANKAALPKIAELLVALPSDLCISLWGDNRIDLSIQGSTQEQAAAIRAYLPGLIWKKEYKQNFGWWEYKTTSPSLGCEVTIYGVTEAPPTCRVERRTIEVEEEVPVAFETRMVAKEVVEVHCGDGD
jgi:hypothetical protein